MFEIMWSGGPNTFSGVWMSRVLLNILGKHNGLEKVTPSLRIVCKLLLVSHVQFTGVYIQMMELSHTVLFLVGTFINRLVEKCDVTFLSPRLPLWVCLGYGLPWLWLILIESSKERKFSSQNLGNTSCFLDSLIITHLIICTLYISIL